MFLIPYRIPDWKENKDICIHQPFYVSMGKSTLLSLFNLILCNSPWDSFHAAKYNLFFSLSHTHTSNIGARSLCLWKLYFLLFDRGTVCGPLGWGCSSSACPLTPSSCRRCMDSLREGPHYCLLDLLDIG